MASISLNNPIIISAAVGGVVALGGYFIINKFLKKGKLKKYDTGLKSYGYLPEDPDILERIREQEEEEEEEEEEERKKDRAPWDFLGSP